MKNYSAKIFFLSFAICLALFFSSVNVQAEDNKIVVMETTMGTIKIKLYTDEAPVTTQNFINLVNQGFYNGILFHRVIDGFMIQGGDPTGTGRGGSKTVIPDEFAPGLSHDRAGIVSMANRGPNTGTSQFFITLGAYKHLDNRHAIFGEIAEGMDVVYSIGKVRTGEGDRPVEDVKIISAYVLSDGVSDGVTQNASEKYATLETSLGTIKIKLFTKEAPYTTQNFIDLINKGFYDGIIFHRVIDGFMIQGGDPTGTGMGGSGKIIPDEFKTGLSHGKEGILSMANAGPHTTSSQFFITLAPQKHLDGGYSIFGEVIEGMDVVSAIGKVKTGLNDRPVEEVKIIKATISE